MRPFKIKLSVEWTDQDVAPDARGVEVTELGVEAWADYAPDQLGLAVMLALPELTKELTTHLTERTGERAVTDQIMAHMRRAAAEGDDRAASVLRHLTEMNPSAGAAPASETTGDAPSAEELAAMFAAPSAVRTRGFHPDLILTDDIEPDQPRRFTVDGSGETTETD